MMLTARDLRVVRGGRPILEVPGLEFKDGRVTAVLGPNGAGKSTLFSVLAFLDLPDTGTISLDGEAIADGATRQAARRRVTLVEQHPLLFRGSVRDNLEWPVRVRGSHEPVDDLARRLGVSDLLARTSRTLSGGETQRVALARALLCRPRVLLLDEPTSAGDRTLRDTLEAVLAAAREAGIAVGLASHQLGDAYRWSDRVLGLAAGRLDTVTPENVFRTTLPAGRGVKAVPCGALTLHVATDREGDAVVTIPPEDIVLSAAPLQSSARNTFPGRIVGIRDDGGERRSVTVDAGTTLVARITDGAVRDLGLTVGGSVVMTVKATAVRVL